MDFDPKGRGGFYVTTDLAQAEDWQSKMKARNNKDLDIYKFEIPNSELNKLNVKVFDSPNAEWADFVKQGRQKTLNHNYDAVSGPMLGNPFPVRDRDAKPKPTKKGSQFAIYSDKAAELFNKRDVRL
ncbi:hypothetical protein Xbed_03620 [Xenorhabdus beddingii]|uniref:DUF3990 domain-containing protein n=1 Tax=Xenorhabdus beddingii TaxID=40578 RepID=A0A1Y2SC27_9GAMM|nr:DUF3990 domain-containing protein [Xenorhabdus beddingii]OTA15096.1 hypothetical protein Xbed_03620 [Xenorhabdus beddingii]